MRGLARFIAIAAVLLPLAAQGETLTILDRTLEFEPPDGYCLLDRGDPYEVQIFDYMAAQQRQGGVELLAMYAVCGEAQAIIEGRATNFFRYGMLVVLPGENGSIAPIPGYTRAEFISYFLTDLPRVNAELKAGIGEAQKLLAESGLLLSQTTVPTVVGSDDNALYAAVSLSADAGEGASPVAAISAFTFAKELPLVLHLYAPGGGDAFEALLDQQARTVADFVAANE